MSMLPAAVSMPAVQPVYQADVTVVHAMQQCREQLHLVCGQFMYQRVQVTTIQGEVHAGTIVGFDDHHLFLDVQGMPETMRQFYPVAGPFFPYSPYASSILPLVLFNLLAISLL